MDYLIVDDQPNFLKTWKRALEVCGNTVFIVRDLTAAWNLLANGKRFDLVIIDIALDRQEIAFQEDYRALQTGLAARGMGGLPMSGQALGLRLWRERKSWKQPYCYLTHNSQLWLEGQNYPDPEFLGLGPLRGPDLVIEKTDVFARNVEAKFRAAFNIWMNEKWLQ